MTKRNFWLFMFRSQVAILVRYLYWLYFLSPILSFLLKIMLIELKMEQINNKAGAVSLDKIHTLIENSTDYLQKMHCDTNKWTRPFKCAVPSCPNAFVKFDPEYKLPFKFHNFPMDLSFRKEWMRRCRMRNDDDTYLVKICSDHFKLDDYERNYKEEFKNPYFKRKLKADAVPTRNLGGNAKILDFDRIDIACEVQHKSVVNQQITEILPPFEIVKPIVDHNVMLKEKVEKLRLEKRELYFKTKAYDRRIKTRRKNIATMKDLYEKHKMGGLTAYQQKNLLSKVFSDAQINVLLGKKKVIWSNDDLAMAFTLRQMSSRECYLYLKQMLNLPLPALACVQKWAASK